MNMNVYDKLSTLYTESKCIMKIERKVEVIRYDLDSKDNYSVGRYLR